MATFKKAGPKDGRGGGFMGTGKQFKGSERSSRPGNSDVRRVGLSHVTYLKEKQAEKDALEEAMGFVDFKGGEDRLGWLMNITTSSVENEETQRTMSALNCYFMCQDGSTFRAQVVYPPYFYVRTKPGTELEVEAFLRRKFEGSLREIEHVEKEDLDLKNHLSGLRRPLLKLSFASVQELMDVKRELLPVVERNARKRSSQAAYAGLGQGSASNAGAVRMDDFLDHIEDMREYDVPYHVRVAIDLEIRCGLWYNVSVADGSARLTHRADLLKRAEIRVCAFDIETTKLPLKFPDASYDMVFMISYMVDGKGYLITNREVVSEDIADLEYTPKPEFPGPFTVYNEPNEVSLLRRWLRHMREIKPGVYVTYNGDFFDWPFLEKRFAFHGMDLNTDLGFKVDEKSGECRSRFACHLDAFAWVQRDSYLPQGSQGLKAVTKAKLGYDPHEVDPEDMLPFAREKPQLMASYSVSDAVATFYLYQIYVQPFIFSLATIIPMPPDEVLRKGSGTLCEMLLMVEAYRKNIVCPNKHTDPAEKYYQGHLLESETYIGGHVECLESGVFRADIPTRFRMEPAAFQGLIDKLDRDLQYAIRHECKLELAEVTNYAEVKAEIQAKLESLRDIPNREEEPLIYHLDVAAMYPNIILTNRLQPSSIKTDEDCAACDFNRPDKKCLRRMDWKWRGEHFMASNSEYTLLKNQIQSEKFPNGDGEEVYFRDLPKANQASMLKERLKKYCQKVYRKVMDKPKHEKRTAGICMKENAFYVDTVLSFRDRRYEYKGLNKVWKGKLSDAKKTGNSILVKEADDMVTLYESLQLAHKCILNSFYGYVMRKGARWYSMEMAGVVTHTGAGIIQNAHALVRQIGKPLELDTDGIWCCLPRSFPENFVFKTSNPKKPKCTISYPCVMLNVDVAENNSNDQYHELVDPVRRIYKVDKRCSIEFEVDGPYRAMVLPASKEEGKLIKKRYAVFNFDGTLAEIKGFELKRRGELKLIKNFQSEVFERFLDGGTLAECYGAVAACANRYLDMLETEGVDLHDSELVSMISESNTMSRALQEYGAQRSCAVTTARRLAHFLGDAMVKDKGLNCQYIVSRYPQGTPVSERAIPVAIFSTELEVRSSWLKKWTKGAYSRESGDMRSIVDWEYYKSRLGGAIQKIITIPAALQKVDNPVPRVKHPDWLGKRVREKEDRRRQQNLLSMFAKQEGQVAAARQLQAAGGNNAITLDVDMEDLGMGGCGGARGRRASLKRKSLTRRGDEGRDADAEGRPANGGDGGDEGVGPLRGRDETTGDAGDGREDKETRARAEARGERGAAEGGPSMDRARGGQGSAGASCQGAQRVGVADGESGALGGGDGSGAAAGAPPPCSREANFEQWLEYSKHKWRAAREERKRRRLEDARRTQRDAREVARGGGLGAGGAGGGTGAGGGVTGKAMRAERGLAAGAYFQHREALVTNSSWQVVLLEPAERPGHFKAWVIVDGAMYCVPLRVPRVFYINSWSSADKANVGEPVRRLLPHSQPVKNLQKVVVPEEEYQRNAHEFAIRMNDPDIEGVYESQIPLDLNAILDIGCICSVQPAVRREGRSLAKGFSLEELVMGTTTDVPYLQDAPGAEISNLKHIYLYMSSCDTRGILILHVPAPATGLVVFVNPFNNRDVTPGSAERYYREAAHAAGSEVEATFDVDYARDDDSAAKRVQRALVQYREQHRHPALLVLECPDDFAPPLFTVTRAVCEIPIVRMPSNARDSQYQAVGWQTHTARLAMHRVVAVGPWMEERVSIARYAHVPVGNFDADSLLFTADVFFARQLRKNSHLLWMSDTPGVPDLGGVSEDRLMWEEVAPLVVCEPGHYDSVTVELKIHHLPVCAMVNSLLMNEAEGGALLGAENDVEGGEGGHAALDETLACAKSFRVLKQLVTTWLDDARSPQGNPYAVQLLLRLLIWFCSPHSRMHEPSLYRTVQKVMEKMLRFLLAEMRKLGATVVFADLSRIIIATGKRTYDQAKGYLDYLLATLKSRDMFELMDLEPSHYWHALLFMDQHNFGAMEARPPEPRGGRRKPMNKGDAAGRKKRRAGADAEDADGGQAGEADRGREDERYREGSIPLSGEEASDSDVQEVEADEEDYDEEEEEDEEGDRGIARADLDAPKIMSNWNIAEFLPEPLQKYFIILVSELLYLPWKDSVQRRQQRLATRGQPSHPSACTPSQTVDARGAVEQEEVDYLKQLINTHFSEKLITVVKEIQRFLSNPDREAQNAGAGEEGEASGLTRAGRLAVREFPQLAGSHLALTSPALELIKFVCAAFALNGRVTDAVLAMRRNLLKLVHVRDFSEEAQFKDPCLSFVLPNIICSYCNDCRDLDICRDPLLMARNWRCSNAECEQPYDVAWIEGLLLQVVQNRARAYQLQDLECGKCHRVRGQ
eukprot:jgi/Mesvir1/28477/Mv15897-RA.2